MSNKVKKSEAIKHLQSLRNIGKVTAEKLYSIGIKTPRQMKKANPKKMYEKLKKRSGGKLDKCVLYQFQGAVLDIPWPECKNITKGQLNQRRRQAQLEIAGFLRDKDE
jgi:nucleotidyltransferase/DNA polymerase involved in DNA repair